MIDEKRAELYTSPGGRFPRYTLPRILTHFHRPIRELPLALPETEPANWAMVPPVLERITFSDLESRPAVQHPGFF
jgi:hypothetical protein